MKSAHISRDSSSLLKDHQLEMLTTVIKYPHSITYVSVWLALWPNWHIKLTTTEGNCGMGWVWFGYYFTLSNRDICAIWSEELLNSLFGKLIFNSCSWQLNKWVIILSSFILFLFDLYYQLSFLCPTHINSLCGRIILWCSTLNNSLTNPIEWRTLNNISWCTQIWFIGQRYSAGKFFLPEN